MLADPQTRRDRRALPWILLCIPSSSTTRMKKLSVQEMMDHIFKRSLFRSMIGSEGHYRPSQHLLRITDLLVVAKPFISLSVFLLLYVLKGHCDYFPLFIFRCLILLRIFFPGTICLWYTAYFGLFFNMVLFFRNVLGEGSGAAANDTNNWLGTMFLSSLLGSFIAESYLGRLWACALFQFIALTVNFKPIFVHWQVSPPHCLNASGPI